MTKLELINYFIPFEDIYNDYIIYCMLPSKYIISLGNYTLNENSCRLGCAVCDENT